MDRQLKQQERALKDEEDRVRKERNGRAFQSAFSDGSSSQLSPPPTRTVADVKFDQDMVKAQREALKNEYEGKTEDGGLLARRVQKANRLEYNQTRDLVWIVVINADEDFEIEGKDAVDNDDDLEIIKDSDLREEIRAERREDEKFMRDEKAYGGKHPEEDVLSRYED